MLGIGANLIKSAYRRGLAYVRDGLKLYMPYRGANHSEVKFVGSGSTYFTTNDYVDCGSDSSLDTGSSAFSVCAWFYATNGAESQTIVSKGASQSSASGDVGWALSITANEAVFFDMNEDSSTTRDATSTAHNAFNINQWHHVAIVRPAGATAGRKIYVDGVDVTSSTANAISDCDDGGQDFKIGVCQSGRYFDGNIKNVGYWSRVLTATEVQNVMYKTYDELSGRLTSNLVSWWALDVDYTDSTGTNNGTNSGSTLNADKYGGDTPVIPRAIDNAPTVQADGIGGGSMVFDSGDYVYLSDSSSYSDTDGFSMAFWVKFDSITGDTALATKHADYADLDNSGEFYIINDDGICEFVILDHSESASIGTKTGTVFATNQWYHVACTHDGGTAATGCKIYIDGVLQTHSANNTGSGFANIEDTANQLRLGVFADGGEPFDGNMCQFGFWSVELTQAQVLSVMEKTYDEFNADDKTSLVSYWALDETLDGDVSLNSEGANSVVEDKVNDSLGSEELGTADNDWNVTSAKWSISSGVLTFDGSGTGEADTTHDGGTIGAFTFSTGKIYKVQFTIANSSGNAVLGFRDNDDNDIVAMDAGSPFTDGSYTFYFAATSDANSFKPEFIANATAGSSFDITSYSLKEVQGNYGELK